MPSPLFDLGQVVITAHAKDVLDQRDVENAIQRHATGDWGEMCEADKRQNDMAVAQDLRIFSAYDGSGTRFWIITEAERSATTILLPDDY